MARRVSLAGPQSDVQGRMATATTGTATLVLGAAASGATTFAAMPVPIADGDIVTYQLIDIGLSPVGKERGIGTYHSAGPSLSRDIVLWSTNGNAKLNLSGNAYVFITADETDYLLPSQARQLLTSSASFYYKPSTGNDTNAGTISSPWATPGPLYARYDFGGQAVTLNLLENTTALTSLGSWAGGGSLTVDFGSHSVTTANGHCIVVGPGALPGPLTIQNTGPLSASGTPLASAILHQGGGKLQLANINFGNCVLAGLWQSGSGGGSPAVSFTGNLTISGNAQNLFLPAAYCVLITGANNPNGPTIISTSGGARSFSNAVLQANASFIDLSNTQWNYAGGALNGTRINNPLNLSFIGGGIP